MNQWIRIGVAALVCIMIAGCKKPVNDQDAVRASIEKHLNGRADLNLTAMIREVKQVSVSGDHATADVEFRLNGSDSRMEVEYTLSRQGMEWVVKGSRPIGMGSGPPEGEQMPLGDQKSGEKQLPSSGPQQ